MKRTIKLRESELRQMISESVKRVINEYKLPNGSDVDDKGNVTTQRNMTFNTRKPNPKRFNLDKNKTRLPNGAIEDNVTGDVTTKNGTFKIRKESINRIVSESIRKVLNEV